MAREIVQPTTNDHDYDEHPAWGLIGASRSQNGPGGAVLFDSDIRHNHTVHITLSKASRKRDLNHDHLYGERQLVSVELSEAQWASFVSSMNQGSGVACTIRSMPDDYNVPATPYQPRLAESLAEVSESADKSLEAIREAFALVKDKPNKGNIRNLEIVLNNAKPNMEFAARSLSKHAENVVQRAKADVEAMVISKAQSLGLEPGDLGVTAPLLGRGE